MKAPVLNKGQIEKLLGETMQKAKRISSCVTECQSIARFQRDADHNFYLDEIMKLLSWVELKLGDAVDEAELEEVKAIYMGQDYSIMKEKVNKPETFDEALRKVANDVVELVLKKQADYGHDNINAFGEFGLSRLWARQHQSLW